MAKKGADVSGSVQAIDLHDEFEMVLFEEPLRYSIFIYLAEKLQKLIFLYFKKRTILYRFCKLHLKLNFMSSQLKRSTAVILKDFHITQLMVVLQHKLMSNNSLGFCLLHWERLWSNWSIPSNLGVIFSQSGLGDIQAIKTLVENLHNEKLTVLLFFKTPIYYSVFKGLKLVHIFVCCMAIKSPVQKHQGPIYFSYEVIMHFQRNAQ